MVNLENTIWKIVLDNQDTDKITFLENGRFKYTVVKADTDVGESYDDESETWKLNDTSITISYSDGYMVLTGKIDSDNSLKGKYKNKKGLEGDWQGYLLSNT